MSTYKKIALILGITILLVVGIIVGRIVLGKVIQKKINKVNPTEVVVINVKKSEFYGYLDSHEPQLVSGRSYLRPR
mgnify:CR=1 FL=1